jgi:hypothetical protein
LALPDRGSVALLPCRSPLTRAPAYTIYAFFEWSLILLDVGFDAVTALDFETFEVIVRDVKGASKGYVQRLPR